jgi:hypothetical protein
MVRTCKQEAMKMKMSSLWPSKVTILNASFFFFKAEMEEFLSTPTVQIMWVTLFYTKQRMLDLSK